MSTVSLMTEDCSRFLPPQHKTLGRRLFGDVSVVRQDPLTTVVSELGMGTRARMIMRDRKRRLCHHIITVIYRSAGKFQNVERFEIETPKASRGNRVGGIPLPS